MALQFQEVGDTGISAQMVSQSGLRSSRTRGTLAAHGCYSPQFLLLQMFLSQSGKVYVLDKAENNPVNVTGKYGTHPAWGAEYDPDANTCA
jgi:hypothetical protein